MLVNYIVACYTDDAFAECEQNLHTILQQELHFLIHSLLEPRCIVDVKMAAVKCGQRGVDRLALCSLCCCIGAQPIPLGCTHFALQERRVGSSSVILSKKTSSGRAGVLRQVASRVSCAAGSAPRTCAPLVQAQLAMRPQKRSTYGCITGSPGTANEGVADGQTLAAASWG